MAVQPIRESAHDVTWLARELHQVRVLVEILRRLLDLRSERTEDRFGSVPRGVALETDEDFVYQDLVNVAAAISRIAVRRAADERSMAPRHPGRAVVPIHDLFQLRAIESWRGMHEQHPVVLQERLRDGAPGARRNVDRCRP